MRKFNLLAMEANYKKTIIFLIMLFILGNAFAYNKVKNFYDWRGNNVYKVCATNTAFSNRLVPMVQINDLDNSISYCFVFSNDNAVMDLYQVLCRMNTATLEETIRTTRWKFWFEADNGWLFYKDAGLN